MFNFIWRKQCQKRKEKFNPNSFSVFAPTWSIFISHKVKKELHFSSNNNGKVIFWCELTCQSLKKWFWKKNTYNKTRDQFYLLQFVYRNLTVGTTHGMFAINLTESHQNVPKDTKTWQKCQIEIFVEWEQFDPTWKKLNFSSFFCLRQLRPLRVLALFHSSALASNSEPLGVD